MLASNSTKFFNSIKMIYYTRRGIFTTNNLFVKLNMNSNASKKLSDEPIKFSKSKAKEWDSYDTFISPKIRETPKVQSFIVIGCFIVIAVYFLGLRKENEFDDLIYQPLEKQIRVDNIYNSPFLNKKIKEYEQYGLDTSKVKSIIKSDQKSN